MRYLVQSFSQVRGQLEPGYGQFLKDRGQALAAAERIIRTRDGVLVMEQQENLFGEGEGEMSVVAAYGHVPHEAGFRRAAWPAPERWEAAKRRRGPVRRERAPEGWWPGAGARNICLPLIPSLGQDRASPATSCAQDRA
ncbi:MAG: hypothetical protein U1E62_03100 [Alsobacter sp.]